MLLLGNIDYFKPANICNTIVTVSTCMTNRYIRVVELIAKSNGISHISMGISNLLFPTNNRFVLRVDCSIFRIHTCV